MKRTSEDEVLRHIIKYHLVCLFFDAESTIQQRDIPQPPPPPKFGAGIEDEVLPEPVAQLNEEITFFTSLEEHLGHSVFLSAG